MKFWFCLILGAATVMAQDLGFGIYSTPPLPVAPACNAPIISQMNPACAFGKNVYMVVWSDGKHQPNRDAADIYCARVEAATGRILDTAGIRVHHADFLQDYPRIAFDGTNFLVVWEDFRSDRDYDIMGARITEAGVVLDPQAIVISAKRGINEARPAVAFASGNYFVAWMDARYYPVWGLYGTRITPDGVVLDSLGIGLDTMSVSAIAAALPANGRVNGSTHNWNTQLSSALAPSLASNGTVFGISYSWDGPPALYAGPTSKCMVGLIDPATGRFSSGPKMVIDNAYKSAITATDNGWAVACHVRGSTGWSGDTRFQVTQYSPLLVATTTALVNITTWVQGSSTTTTRYGDGLGGRSGSGNFNTPAIGNCSGSFPIGAMDVVWNLVGASRLTTALFVGRPAFTSATADTIERNWEKKQEVAKPFIGNGTAECLLVYECSTGLNQHKVMSRILRKP